MKISQLKIGYWYEFTNCEGTVFYCEYLGGKSYDKIHYLYGGHHVFHFLDGWKYDYSVKDIGTSMKPCHKKFSDYLNLLVTNLSNGTK